MKEKLNKGIILPIWLITSIIIPLLLAFVFTIFSTIRNVDIIKEGIKDLNYRMVRIENVIDKNSHIGGNAQK